MVSCQDYLFYLYRCLRMSADPHFPGGGPGHPHGSVRFLEVHPEVLGAARGRWTVGED